MLRVNPKLTSDDKPPVIHLDDLALRRSDSSVLPSRDRAAALRRLGRLADRRAVPAAQVSLASGIGSMFQNIAGMFGVVIATAVFG